MKKHRIKNGAVKPKTVTIDTDFEEYVKRGFNNMEPGDMFHLDFIYSAAPTISHYSIMKVNDPFVVLGKNCNPDSDKHRSDFIDIMHLTPITLDEYKKLAVNIMRAESPMSEFIRYRTIRSIDRFLSYDEPVYTSETLLLWNLSIHELGLAGMEYMEDYTMDDREEIKYPYFNDSQNLYPYLSNGNGSYIRQEYKKFNYFTRTKVIDDQSTYHINPRYMDPEPNRITNRDMFYLPCVRLCI